VPHQIVEKHYHRIRVQNNQHVGMSWPLGIRKETNDVITVVSEVLWHINISFKREMLHFL